MSKRFKRFTSILLCLILLSALLVVSRIDRSAQAKAEADGSAENPYLIYTVEDLRTINDTLADPAYTADRSHYRLMNDLDLSREGPWSAIGGTDYIFEGEFDGQGHTIHGLNHLSEDAESTLYGLFGYSSGRIKNLNLQNVVFDLHQERFRPYDYLVVGPLVAYNLGEVQDVYVSGQIQIYGQNEANLSYSIGGVVGHNEGLIRRVQNAADVSFTAPYKEIEYPSHVTVGGIAGVNDREGEIDFATNSGVIVNTLGISYVNAAGGIVGRSNGYMNQVANYGAVTVSGYEASAGGISGTADRGLIENAYNHGCIKGVFAGGIVGTGLRVEVKMAYNASELHGTRAAGEIIGSAFYLPVTIRESYFLDQSNEAVGLDLYGKTPFLVQASALNEAEFSHPEHFKRWDFNWDWRISPAGLNRGKPTFYKLISAALVELPSQLDYSYGESLNLAGSRLLYRLQHLEERFQEISMDQISGYDPYVLGEQSITIEDDYIEASFTVVVHPLETESESSSELETETSQAPQETSESERHSESEIATSQETTIETTEESHTETQSESSRETSFESSSTSSQETDIKSPATSILETDTKSPATSNYETDIESPATSILDTILESSSSENMDREEASTLLTDKLSTTEAEPTLSYLDLPATGYVDSSPFYAWPLVGSGGLGLGILLRMRWRKKKK